MSDSKNFVGAKAEYSALIREAFSLGVVGLTELDVTEHGVFLEATVVNYLKGRTVPSSYDKHREFVNAIEKTLRIKGSERLAEFSLLSNRLDPAFRKVESLRRRKVSTPTYIPNDDAIFRVLSASRNAVLILVDSVDFYVTSSRSYLDESGVLVLDEKGSLNYEGINCSRPPPPKLGNSPIYYGYPDCFFDTKSALSTFTEEFHAMPELREALASWISSCSKIERTLIEFWALMRIGSEHPILDINKKLADRRVSILTKFKCASSSDLSVSPGYLSEIHEHALNAMAEIFELDPIIVAGRLTIQREFIRRGVPLTVEKLD